MSNNIKVKLNFFRYCRTQKKVKLYENYWKIIDEKGKLIDKMENRNGRILILSDKNLDEFELENRNSIKNLR